MANIAITRESALHSQLLDIARSCDIAVVVGIPGVGKSFFVRQLALIAQQENRLVHLLQWDVTRRAFEIDDLLIRYPDSENSETHPFIRKSVGEWVRHGILNWYQEHGGSEHLLICEAPLVGNRLIELARPLDDKAEAILCGSRSRFILPIPSIKVRAAIEGKRAETSSAPQHGREAFDAPPTLVDEVSQEIYAMGHERGIVAEPTNPPAYDPAGYQAVFEHLLRYRRTTVLHIDEILEDGGSVYDVKDVVSEVTASPREVRDIRLYLETNFTPEEIDNHVDQWHQLE